MLRYGDNINPAAHQIIIEYILGKKGGIVNRHVSSFVEFGCSTGALGGLILSRYSGIEWVGIDYDQQALDIASTRLSRTIQMDLNKVSREELDSIDYKPDVLVMIDVIEHLYEPQRFMGVIRQIFSEALVLCILPNIACFRTYEKLSRHEFDYEDSGIFDATHRTFYTASSAHKLFSELGYRSLIDPIYLTEPGAERLLTTTQGFPISVGTESFQVRIETKDQLKSICSYGFGILLQPRV